MAVDLLLTGVTETGLGAGVQGLVNVTVPVLTLMNLSDEPGTPGGVMHWTSPAGKHYATHPNTRLSPHSTTNTTNTASERGPSSTTAQRLIDVWTNLADPEPNPDRPGPDWNSTPF